MSAKPDPYHASDDYELIEAAVLETARGRWFLAEHARRERAAERAQLLVSVRRLERVSQDTLNAVQFQTLAEDLARKLDDVLRVVQAAHPVADDAGSEAQRLIEQRLVEPRPFIAR